MEVGTGPGWGAARTGLKNNPSSFKSVSKHRRGGSVRFALAPSTAASGEPREGRDDEGVGTGGDGGGGGGGGDNIEHTRRATHSHVGIGLLHLAHLRPRFYDPLIGGFWPSASGGDVNRARGTETNSQPRRGKQASGVYNHLQDSTRQRGYLVVTGVEHCPGTDRAPQYPHVEKVEPVTRGGIHRGDDAPPPKMSTLVQADPPPPPPHLTVPHAYETITTPDPPPRTTAGYIGITGIERRPQTSSASQYPRIDSVNLDTVEVTKRGMCGGYESPMPPSQQRHMYEKISPRPSTATNSDYVFIAGVDRCPGTARAPQYPHVRPVASITSPAMFVRVDADVDGAGEIVWPSDNSGMCEHEQAMTSSQEEAATPYEHERSDTPYEDEQITPTQPQAGMHQGESEYVVVTGVDRCPGTGRAPQYPRFQPTDAQLKERVRYETIRPFVVTTPVMHVEQQRQQQQQQQPQQNEPEYAIVTGIERCPGTARAPQYPRFHPTAGGETVVTCPDESILCGAPLQREQKQLEPEYAVVTGIERCPGTARAPQYPRFHPTARSDAVTGRPGEVTLSGPREEHEPEYAVVTGIERCPGTARAPQYPRFHPTHGGDVVVSRANEEIILLGQPTQSVHEQNESEYAVVTGVERCPGTARAPQYPRFRPLGELAVVDPWAPDRLADLCVQRSLWPVNRSVESQ